MNISQNPSTTELPRPPVSENNINALHEYGEMVLDDYESFKRNFMEWLLNEGKDLYRRKGFAESTVEHTHYKVDEAYRWKWNQTGEYTKEFTPEEATELIDFMMKKTDHPDRYIYGFEKSIRRLFKYFRNEMNQDIGEWEHDIPVEQNSGNDAKIKNRFYPQEMNALYEATLNDNSIKSYYNKSMTTEERDSLKRYVAQKLGIPKAEVGPDHFKLASSWKLPSIIAVTCDTGLRPIEVGRAKVSWFDLDNHEMVVPLEESTKNKQQWNCKLTKKTLNAVRNWIQERNSYEKYQSTDGMWRTRHGNRYGSSSLNKTLNKYMEKVGIEQQHRKLSWYSFRHGAATLWAEQEDIYFAKEQLRHKNVDTTLQYTNNSGTTERHPESRW
jgi:integrase